MKTGVELIAEERERQVSAEGWTQEHDDQHVVSELSRAATSYLVASRVGGIHEGQPCPAPESWPWEKVWWKPSEDPVRNLVKAGALIAAEIDRLQRKAA